MKPPPWYEVEGRTVCEVCRGPVPSAEPTLRNSAGEGQAVAAEVDWSRILCIVAGLGLAAVSVNYLLLNPSEGEVLGEGIVNLHRLAIGQTSGIAGAVFLAAGLRG